uniref:Mutator-like transposase domain-containing protein n=1 Tax=Anopheles dirus TaxID=7168 RepID=A0A182N2K1_9DIPT
MMTRRKSVHESAVQAQLLLQERSVEEQMGAIATGIANILAPSAAAAQSGHGSSATQTTGAGTALSQSNAPKTPLSTGLETKKGSSSSLQGAAPLTSCNQATKTSAMGRSKTPRINKRSAPSVDAPLPQLGATGVSMMAGAGATQSTGTGLGVTAGVGAAATSAGQSGPNPVQQTLAQNGMDPDEIPKFKGYRIIEIDHFLQWAAYSQFMHSKHCPGGLLKPYQEYISGCYSTFAMKCSKCSAIITRSSENYIHHNKLMNRLVKGTVQLGKDYDEMQQFMESLEVPFVTREEFQSIRGQVSSSLEDQSSLQRAVEELERASSVNSKRKRHGSCKYHYEVLKVYLNKKMKKMEENLQLSVNDSVALAVNAHLKNVSHVQLVPNVLTSTTSANCTTIGTVNGTIATASNSIGNLAIGTINVQSTGPLVGSTLNGSNGSASSTSSNGGYSNSNLTSNNNTRTLTLLPDPTIGGGLPSGGRLPPGNREPQH